MASQAPGEPSDTRRGGRKRNKREYDAGTPFSVPALIVGGSDITGAGAETKSTFNIDWTFVWTGSTTFNAYKVGSLVTLEIPSIVRTNDTDPPGPSLPSISGGFLPVHLRPQLTTYFLVAISANGNDVTGLLRLFADGSIAITRYDGVDFFDGQQSNISPTTIVYSSP